MDYTDLDVNLVIYYRKLGLDTAKIQEKTGFELEFIVKVIRKAKESGYIFPQSNQKPLKNQKLWLKTLHHTKTPSKNLS